MKQHMAGFLKEEFPYYVGEIDGKITGYCYLHNWNNHTAYSSTKKITLYLDKNKKEKDWQLIIHIENLT